MLRLNDFQRLASVRQPYEKYQKNADEIKGSYENIQQGQYNNDIILIYFSKCQNLRPFLY